MRYDFRDPAPEGRFSPPTACPFCKSKELAAADKPITSATYWRCLTCGELWNAERLEAASRYGPRYR